MTCVRSGRLPINTHGGLLAEGYLHGMNTVAEAVLQVQGRGGERQVAEHEVVRRHLRCADGRLGAHWSLTDRPLTRLLAGAPDAGSRRAGRDLGAEPAGLRAGGSLTLASVGVSGRSSRRRR